MRWKKKAGRIGSSFVDYLRAEGSCEETKAVAISRVLTWQLEEAMRKTGPSQNKMARRMRDSCRQLARILICR